MRCVLQVSASTTVVNTIIKLVRGQVISGIPVLEGVGDDYGPRAGIRAVVHSHTFLTNRSENGGT